MEVGKGDCKKFTTFILAVLKAKGIPAFAKVVSYDGFAWAHIYAIVPNGNGYITLDPVNHCKYNSEVDYIKAQNFYLDGSKSNIMTKLSLMGSLGKLSPQSAVAGIGEASDDFLGDVSETFGGRRNPFKSCHNSRALSGLGNDYMSGIGDENQMADEYLSGIEELTGEDSDLGKKSKEQKQEKKINKTVNKTLRQQNHAAKKTPQVKAAKKAQRKKIFKGAKKVGFAPVRGAFLALIALGGALSHTPIKINLAQKLAKSWQKDNGAKVVKVWEAYGGKREALAKAINRAAKTNLSGEDIAVGIDGAFDLSGIGSAAAVASTIAVAAPITIAMMKLFANDKDIVSEGEAELVENTVDVIEDKEMKKADGDPQKVMKKAQATPLVKAGEEMDAGGNKETQRDIIDEAKQEPEHQEGDSEDFKPATAKSGRTVAPSNNAAQNTQTPVSTDQDKGPQEQTNNLLPARADQFRTAKSFAGNWRLPYTWLKGLLLVILLSDIFKVPELLASVVGSGMLGMLIYTSILSLTKNKMTHGKI
jgi:hypothetical protein